VNTKSNAIARHQFLRRAETDVPASRPERRPGRCIGERRLRDARRRIHRNQLRDPTADRVDWRQRHLRTACRDHLLERLRAGKQRVEAIAGRFRLAGAQHAQVVLEMVRELFRRAELHHPGDAFERMEVAEQLVEHAAIDRAAADRGFEREQQTARAHEVLVALGVVVVEKIGKTDLVERSALARRPGGDHAPTTAARAERTAW
jgi:hypothetical protein